MTNSDLPTMSPRSILVALCQGIKDMYLSQPFLVIFFIVLVAFTVLSITLFTIIAGDSDSQMFSPLDEERKIFLSPDPDFLHSPSSESENSDMDSSLEFVIKRKFEVNDANVERLLAAHRDHVGGKLPEEIWNDRTSFSVDSRDVLQRVKEGDETED
jgi:hypothetical protein